MTPARSLTTKAWRRVVAATASQETRTLPSSMPFAGGGPVETKRSTYRRRHFGFDNAEKFRFAPLRCARPLAAADARKLIHLDTLNTV